MIRDLLLNLKENDIVTFADGGQAQVCYFEFSRNENGEPIIIIEYFEAPDSYIYYINGCVNYADVPTLHDIVAIQNLDLEHVSTCFINVYERFKYYNPVARPDNVEFSKPYLSLGPAYESYEAAQDVRVNAEWVNTLRVLFDNLEKKIIHIGVRK